MKTTLNNYSREHLYFNEDNNERVKIASVNSSGVAIVRNKKGSYYMAKIGNLKRIY